MPKGHGHKVCSSGRLQSHANPLHVRGQEIERPFMSWCKRWGSLDLVLDNQYPNKIVDLHVCDQRQLRTGRRISPQPCLPLRTPSTLWVCKSSLHRHSRTQEACSSRRQLGTSSTVHGMAVFPRLFVSSLPSWHFEDRQRSATLAYLVALPSSCLGKRSASDQADENQENDRRFHFAASTI